MRSFNKLINSSVYSREKKVNWLIIQIIIQGVEGKKEDKINTNLIENLKITGKIVDRIIDRTIIDKITKDKEDRVLIITSLIWRRITFQLKRKCCRLKEEESKDYLLWWFSLRWSTELKKKFIRYSISLQGLQLEVFFHYALQVKNTVLLNYY